ncbi:zf-HC2 domain-containing protein [Calidifontibacter sp. DB0510]|uniref:Zf-HC2 domain-containing protein n=1 Tax=Metallococcus carri TaxID=1656884 RepID=A0A967B3N4_9MICO|nr:zf-HC2 domain-containing protein [Metallococcus carri]NHN56680.1 zf-HC2 domain-containing protein [Metallococcus carri]NOP38979.1 zf-HC2 domain-containing protein [Calidifontibacter sp. DB2511S]
MNEHDDLAQWDAAYVLGALSSAERAAFERHLPGCEVCTRAVADLAAMPGLLGRLDAASAYELLGGTHEEPPADLGQRLQAAARDELRARRRRHTASWGIGAVAAAAAILAAVVIPGQVGERAPAAPAVAMSQVVPGPLDASVRLTAKPWGTEVRMDCRYATGSGAPVTYGLYVVDAAGNASQISTWSALPGKPASLTAATALPRNGIQQVQVRTMSGAVILRAEPGT